MIYTENFHPSTDSKLICTCGHSLCDKRSVSQEVLNKVQLLRTYLNTPLQITSGGRCPYHPNESHRKVPADHQRQRGIDIACRNSALRGKLVAQAMMLGFNAIGIHDSFIHLGLRAELKTDDILMWTYP